MKRLLALTTLCVAFGALAQDRADIDRTQIIGNRELPKVLYIVPWKKDHSSARSPISPTTLQPRQL